MSSSREDVDKQVDSVIMHADVIDDDEVSVVNSSRNINHNNTSNHATGPVSDRSDHQSCLQPMGRDQNDSSKSCLQNLGHDSEISPRLLSKGRGFNMGKEESCYKSHDFAQPSSVPPNSSSTFRVHPSVPSTLSRPPMEGFSDQQLNILQAMQQQQMHMFKGLLQETVKDIDDGRSDRSRSRPTSRSKPSSKRRKRSRSSSDSESSSRSRYSKRHAVDDRSYAGSPQRNDERRDDDDAISVQAPRSILGSDKEDNDGQEPPCIDPVENANKILLANPYAVTKGCVYDMNVLEWWEQQRTNMLETKQKDDLLEGLKPDSSIAHYFKAPDTPESMRKTMKKSKFEAWKQDNTMWSVQSDMLRSSLPLLKAIEKAEDPLSDKAEIRALLCSSGSLLGSAVQRLSNHRQRHLDPFMKEGYLNNAKPSMGSILGDKWQEKVEEDDKLNKVTLKVLKTPGPTAFKTARKQDPHPHKAKSYSSYKDKYQGGYQKSHKPKYHQPSQGHSSNQNQQGFFRGGYKDQQKGKDHQSYSKKFPKN